MMVRVDDPLVRRAMFGCSTCCVLSFRRHVSDRRVSQVAASAVGDRPVYLLRARVQAVLLKDGGFVAIRFDLLFSSCLA